MPVPTEAFKSSPAFRIAFRAPGTVVDSNRDNLTLSTPWLGGAVYEGIFSDPISLPSPQGLALYRSGDLFLGHASVPFVSGDLAARAQQLYESIFRACGERQLYRIWNYVPQINAVTAGLENYQAFCKGRSLAFENGFGGAFQGRLPAASAVGCAGGSLDVVFVAGDAGPRHVENPEQIPAYHYPLEYGPRSPSFSRATVVDTSASRWVFISGTAAIKGHSTVSPGSLHEQIACTVDNLRLISRSCELGENLGANPDGGWARHFKVYLRRPEDFPTAQTALAKALFRPADRVSYLHADICRAALSIEIEATLVRAL